MKQIHGIFAVTVTHFQENGEIDYAACAKHINWLIESGVHGLLPLGATGEFSALTLEERKAFAEFAMKEVAGRVPVIIGAVSTNVDVTLEVAKHAASIGADGVMILPPPGLHPSQDEIYAFYKHISENVTLPVMIYNNPGSSGVNILPETLDKIADLPHMGFLKESTGDIMRLTRAVDELVERNKVVCRKGVYAVPDPKTGNAVECTLVKLAGKFGFARPVQPDGQDIFIPGKYLMGAMPATRCWCRCSSIRA